MGEREECKTENGGEIFYTIFSIGLKLLLFYTNKFTIIIMNQTNKLEIEKKTIHWMKKEKIL